MDMQDDDDDDDGGSDGGVGVAASFITSSCCCCCCCFPLSGTADDCLLSSATAAHKLPFTACPGPDPGQLASL